MCVLLYFGAFYKRELNWTQGNKSGTFWLKGGTEENEAGHIIPLCSICTPNTFTVP